MSTVTSFVRRKNSILCIHRHGMKIPDTLTYLKINTLDFRQYLEGQLGIVTHYENESWTLKKQYKQSINYVTAKLLRIPWIAKKTNKWITEKFNAKFSLKEQMSRLKISHFGNIMRRPSLWKSLECWE